VVIAVAAKKMFRPEQRSSIPSTVPGLHPTFTATARSSSSRRSSRPCMSPLSALTAQAATTLRRAAGARHDVHAGLGLQGHHDRPCDVAVRHQRDLGAHLAHLP
jgi:hypothetical protein